MANELAIPTNVPEITSLAQSFVQSGYFQDTRQLAQAVVKIQAGRELGLPPVFSIQNINLIRGRLTSSANTLALLVKRSGRYNYRIKEHSDTVCAITFYERDGDKWVEVGESKFTMDDAKRADLVKPDSGWAKYPRAMLFSRAISQGARIYAPDAIGGVYTDEEIRSIPGKPEDAETVIAEPETQEVKPIEPKPVMPTAETRKAMAKVVNEKLKAQPDALQSPQNAQQPALPVTPAPKATPELTIKEYKRDPATVKTIGMLVNSLMADYNLDAKATYSKLGIASSREYKGNPSEDYARIADEQ